VTDPRHPLERMLGRRRFFARGGLGLASIALAHLDSRTLHAESRAPSTKNPHFRPRARSVIHLNMTGAPSHVDLFERKPLLVELDQKPIPESFMEGQRFVFIDIKKPPNLLAPVFPQQRCGERGVWMSKLLPRMSEIVDSLTFVRTVHTDEVNHVPAELVFGTGSARSGRPMIGAWVTYGLGSENEDLPGYVVLASGKAGRCGTICVGSGFLPSKYQGVPLRSEGDAVLFLSDPKGVDRKLRRDWLDSVAALNHESFARIGDPEIESRIANHELAFRMQTSVPELMDLTTESAETHALYGTTPGKTSFSNNCLLARRMVERGVRFIELKHGGWDHHGGGDQNLITNLPERCQQIDQGVAALIIDLERRGLLDQTLVVFGGEFGRTPLLQAAYDPKDLGRDHLAAAFPLLLAGGGVKRGIDFGETDELGMAPVKDPVHVHDFQATLLHLLGLEHTKLTYRFQGRDYRLTDVHGEVVHGLLA